MTALGWRAIAAVLALAAGVWPRNLSNVSYRQEALAHTAGIGRSYMSGIERGVRNCSVLQVLKIAKALRVSVGDLFPR